MIEFLKELPSQNLYVLGKRVESSLIEDGYVDSMLVFFETIFKIIDRERQGISKQQYYKKDKHLSNLIERTDFIEYINSTFQISDNQIDTINDIRKNGNQFKHENETISYSKNIGDVIAIKRVRFECLFFVASRYYTVRTRKPPPLWSESEFNSLLNPKHISINDQRVKVIEHTIQELQNVLQKQKEFEKTTTEQIKEIQQIIKEKDTHGIETEQMLVHVLNDVRHLSDNLNTLSQRSVTDSININNKETNENTNDCQKESVDTTIHISQKKQNKKEQPFEHQSIIEKLQLKRNESIREMDSNYRAFLNKTKDELYKMSDSEFEEILSRQKIYLSIRKQVCDNIIDRAREYYNHYYFIFQQSGYSTISMKPSQVPDHQFNNFPECHDVSTLIPQYAVKKNQQEGNINSLYRAKRERVCKVCGKVYTSKSKSKTCPKCKSIKLSEV